MIKVINKLQDLAAIVARERDNKDQGTICTLSVQPRNRLLVFPCGRGLKEHDFLSSWY